jgi:hypothetical protein
MRPFKSVFSKKRLTSIALASLLFCAFTVQHAQALDEEFFTGNDIIWFDYEAACSSNLTGSTVKEWIWSYLKGKELSDEQAAGIMGNMQAESGFVPTRHQDPNGDVWTSEYSANAWGLVQWDGGRRFSPPNKGVIGRLREEKPNLAKYIEVAYDTVRNPSVQIPEADLKELTTFELDYMYGESIVRRVTAKGYGNAGNEWNTLKLQQTIENATVFWHNNFEVSNDTAAEVLSSRGGAAKQIYDEFAGKSGGGSSSGTAGAGNCANTGTLETTIFSYAWPNYQATTTSKKAEYAAAVSKAQAEGRYVGGGAYPGVDCGGFVTTLMYDSGFEKTYNSNARGGNTKSQKVWLDNNWTSLGNASSIDTGQLKAGDVAMSDGHTFVYAGKGEQMGEFGKNDSKYTGVASASYGGTGAPWRAPMAGHESLIDGDFTWYRKR